MLADEIKTEIQAAYRQYLGSRGLKPRHGQKLMIAKIANTLSTEANEGEGPICVVEAGTGTGKTLGYLIAAIPLAKSLDLKLVIATATVALQEQLINKDIPELLASTSLEFSYALAKGRRRYLCLAQLENHLQPNESRQRLLNLHDDNPLSQDEDTIAVYQEFQTALGDGEWKGDRDNWHSPIPQDLWSPLTVDNAGCMNTNCSYYEQCCYFRSRRSIFKSDVIVTNQDLVLSDLALGGGVVLPDPEDSIYIFDEGHHLAVKSNSHFASNAKIKSTLTWLDSVRDSLSKLDKENFLENQFSDRFKPLRTRCRQGLEELLNLLQQIADAEVELDNYGQQSRIPFKLGRVPEPVQQSADNLVTPFKQLASLLGDTADDLLGMAETAADAVDRASAEHLYPQVGGMRKRCEGMVELLQGFADDDDLDVPIARWLTLSERDGYSDIELSVSPVLAAENLQENLWSACAAAVVTSATLSALGKFDILKMRAGLPERTEFLRISSPFKYAEKAILSVPRLGCNPKDSAAHTAAIVKALPMLLHKPVAALMLFSSRRQMQDVLGDLSPDIAKMILCQDDYQKNQLLEHHRQRVNDGVDSLIFGLASYAEGVDLPGKYCTHVLIARIPFAMPNDPVGGTLSDWLEQQGKKPFFELQVPDAAFGLMQACGRLLRSEADSGRITLFDERIVLQRYGLQILDSLPPFRREVFKESCQ